MTDRVSSLDPELRELIRKNLVRGGISLLALALLAAFLMTQFRAELDATTSWVFDSVGLLGLIGVIFMTDAFVSPFPPDTVLILLAASPYHDSWLWLIPLIGVVSVLAGYAGYGAAFALSGRGWTEAWLGRFRNDSRKLVLRYGPWAVALAALTPVPFSITCWTAGLLQLPFRHVWIPCLLRIPRFVLYYAAIAYFPQLFS